jgi:Rad3-related DNA helicase
MTRVIQAAGRLIRSPGDQGVIALLDERFLNGLYSRYLPTHWLPAEGLEALVGDPEEVASSFFQPAARA